MPPKTPIHCTPGGCLYRYSEWQYLNRALNQGEFRLRPASSFKDIAGDLARQDNELIRIRHVASESVTMINHRSGQELKSISPLKFEEKSDTDYLVLCFSTKWDPTLFSEFHGTDACLVVREVEEFQNRIHGAVEHLAPGWVGFDIAVFYDRPHPLGPWFSKPPSFAHQEEWRFAWIPKVRSQQLPYLTVSIGSIADIAEIRRLSV